MFQLLLKNRKIGIKNRREIQNAFGDEAPPYYYIVEEVPP